MEGIRTRRVGYVTHEIAMMGLGPNRVELPQIYIYSGGLGTLAGAIARAARNLNVPMVIFSLAARGGYCDQYIYEEGGTVHMGHKNVYREYPDLWLDTGITVDIPVCDGSIKANVKKISGVYGTVDVYLLDADIDENGDFWAVSRANTRYLYAGPSDVGGNDERQIVQDMILGIGAVKAADALGLNIELWHMNESHTVPVALELLKRELPIPVVLDSHNKKDRGSMIDEAIKRVQQKAIYTNHTPDPAGNKRYDLGMFTRLYRDLPRDIVARLGDDGRSPEGFNLGNASLRLSRLANAVSKKHLEVTKSMFAGVWDGAEIISITNGSLLRDFFQDPIFANARTADELRTAKMFGKRSLNEFLRGYCGREIDLNTQVISWCRRFARYKRPDLLLTYGRDWLKDRLANGKFYLIVAGKPHPDDHPMVAAWTNLLRLSKEYPNLIMVPNYDMRISKIIKAGSDVWLNTPRVGMEACGTSGQSAAAEGGINVSTLDGWMFEADRNNFYYFGTQFPSATMDVYDANDEKNGLTVVLDRANDAYYGSPDEWNKMALRAKFEAEKVWNAERMMQEYVDKMYTF